MSNQDVESPEERNAFDDYVAFHSSRSANWETTSGVVAAVLGAIAIPAALACWHWEVRGAFGTVSYFAASIAGLFCVVHMLLYFWRRNAWW
jgi:hypothetical protein